MDFKRQPQDNSGQVCASGTDINTFWAEIGTGGDIYKTTTGWDPVMVPDGVECKGVDIQVRPFADADALGEDPIPFLFSSESDGAGSVSVLGSISLSIAKNSGIYGYVWSGVADRKIAVITGA